MSADAALEQLRERQQVGIGGGGKTRGELPGDCPCWRGDLVTFSAVPIWQLSLPKSTIPVSSWAVW